ncbi:hypothetical protein [Saccharomonospora viridis]|uniref:Uncharacterized protein n=1 Tax=Saccharomonospora viridis (strain ATCC 15386 / DSM 43017 / JCM 3036 / CCUG 5913 / NBRC 12207 / NCIMB 9602 / P101) TaxID=471857 RepID=C7MQG2_SACVD|nr:hypothetical protein Svir_14210 [Saccharomonospora viridis DSM 43017]
MSEHPKTVTCPHRRPSSTRTSTAALSARAPLVATPRRSEGHPAGRPITAISVTFRHECDGERQCGRIWPEPATEVKTTTAELTARIGGRAE